MFKDDDRLLNVTKGETVVITGFSGAKYLKARRKKRKGETAAAEGGGGGDADLAAAGPSEGFVSLTTIKDGAAIHAEAVAFKEGAKQAKDAAKAEAAGAAAAEQAAAKEVVQAELRANKAEDLLTVAYDSGDPVMLAAATAQAADYARLAALARQPLMDSAEGVARLSEVAGGVKAADKLAVGVVSTQKMKTRRDAHKAAEAAAAAAGKPAPAKQPAAAVLAPGALPPNREAFKSVASAASALTTLTGG